MPGAHIFCLSSQFQPADQNRLIFYPNSRNCTVRHWWPLKSGFPHTRTENSQDWDCSVQISSISCATVGPFKPLSVLPLLDDGITCQSSYRINRNCTELWEITHASLVSSSKHYKREVMQTSWRNRWVHLVPGTYGRLSDCFFSRCQWERIYWASYFWHRLRHFLA